MKYVCGFMFLLLFSTHLQAQDRFVAIRSKLDSLSASSPGLKDKINISLSGTSIQDYIRFVAEANKLNVTIDPSIIGKIYNNFKDETAESVFIFMCKQYILDINITGDIISFFPFVEAKATPKYVEKKIDVSYDKDAGLLTFDLSNDTLSKVAKAIAFLSEKNISYTPEIANKLLSGYAVKLPIKDALQYLGMSNGVSVFESKKNAFMLRATEKLNPKEADALNRDLQNN